tara:strand:+ start:583 stop:723 length:141 start_codon:yes stop_codon:yes gene_type:complete
MESLQLPVYSLQDQKLLRDRKAVKNYLEHWQQMQMLCLVPSNGLNK